MDALSLYLHIPFCQRRCGYCDFNTYAGLDNLIPAYVEALASEAVFYGELNESGENLPVHTVFFGGGTPSLLTVDQFERLIGQIQASFTLLRDCEITIEANPGTVSAAQLAGIRELGVNRISLGVQSSNLDELVTLDRLHGFREAQTAVVDARKAGFDNLSMDLIYGIPGQTMSTWARSLGDVLSLSPEHLSLYSLTVEDGTPLAARVASGYVSVPDDDLAADFYDYASKVLGDAGYLHYEISNWGLLRGAEAMISRHNRQYWRNLPYVGLGAGAHGYYQGVRYANSLGVADYIRQMKGDAVERFSPVAAEQHNVGQAEEMGETMMMGLRLLQEGVSAERFSARFGVEMMAVYGEDINRLLGLGLLEWAGERSDTLRLTERGYLLGNQVFSAFV